MPDVKNPQLGRKRNKIRRAVSSKTTRRKKISCCGKKKTSGWQLSCEQGSNLLEPRAVYIVERGQPVAVDIEYSYHLAVAP